jgi:hypothetical protein
MIVAAVSLALAGCQKPVAGRPETAAVTVTVTLNGAPLDGAAVSFQPVDSAGKGAAGTTGADGRAKMMTFEPNDGAIPGKYRIAVSKSGAGGSKSMSMEEYGQMMKKVSPGGKSSGAPKQTVPQKYTNAATSGFEFDVLKGKENTLTLELKE